MLTTAAAVAGVPWCYAGQPNYKFGGGGVAMRRLTLLASAVALGVIVSGSAVSQSSSPPLGRDARRIGQQPQSEPKKQPRLDVHGDPLPEGAVARFGTTRLRHEPTKSDGWVVRAISPDGKILATASWHEARFWSLEDGKLLKGVPHQGACFSDCHYAGRKGLRGLPP
jgi:hypothetical protein